MANTKICTWIHLDSARESSRFYQMTGRSTDRRFQEIYWKCVAVYLATSIRHNTRADHFLFSNTTSPPDTTHLPIRRLLDEWDVRFERVPFETLPPDGFADAWRNQFYVVDLVRRMAQISDDENDCWFLLDSDCVWIDTAETMTGAVRRNGALTYAIPYPPQWNINGITRNDLKQIDEELGLRTSDGLPMYFGGEIFAATGRDAARIASELDATWKATLDRFRNGKRFFTEEAHALSFVYRKLGYPPGTGNAFLRRIWTGLPLQTNNASPMDLGLTVWHLPLEKRYGIPRLFDEVIDPNSEFWRIPVGGQFSRYLGRKLGVHRRTTSKLIRDAAVWARMKVS